MSCWLGPLQQPRPAGLMARGAALWAEVPGCAAAGTSSAGVVCSKHHSVPVAGTMAAWVRCSATGTWLCACVAVRHSIRGAADSCTVTSCAMCTHQLVRGAPAGGSRAESGSFQVQRLLPKTCMYQCGGGHPASGWQFQLGLGWPWLLRSGHSCFGLTLLTSGSW